MEGVLPYRARRVIRRSGLPRLFHRGGLFETARWRLVSWNLLVLLVILFILEVAVYGFYSGSVYSEVDQQLQTEQARIQDWFLANPEYAPGGLPLDQQSVIDPSFEIYIAGLNGQVYESTYCDTAQLIVLRCPTTGLTPASEDALHDVAQKIIQRRFTAPADIRLGRVNGQPARVLTFPIMGPGGVAQGLIQISRQVESEQASIHQLRQLLITGFGASVVISILGSFFLASRALIPIRSAFSRQRQFTADASHELRTPLALIRANAEVLCRHADRLPEEDAELIPEIISETDHLHRLISNLLTLARSDAEKVQLATKPVDLAQLVEGVHQDLQMIAEARGIQTSLTATSPTVVQGDETRLRQLVLILLDNALKYTDPGGRVDIALNRGDGRVKLTVADTGIGIPAADLPRIFDRFYRVDRAREHVSGGTGLGLAIARWIVQAHRGSIKAESELGKGTKFRIELPA